MRIDQRLKVCFHGVVMRQRTVEPILSRQVLDPRMQHANMIRHNVENNLHAARMNRLCQMLVIGHRSKVRIDSIEIDRRANRDRTRAHPRRSSKQVSSKGLSRRGFAGNRGIVRRRESPRHASYEAFHGRSRVDCLPDRHPQNGQS